MEINDIDTVFADIMLIHFFVKTWTLITITGEKLNKL
jgi:hypothetical protein